MQYYGSTQNCALESVARIAEFALAQPPTGY
jgi:hypothetical protein